MEKKLQFMWKSMAMIVVASICSGCASIVSGTRQNVTINSNPSLAMVKVNGIERGRTPMILDLKRLQKHTIKIELEDYQPYCITLKKGINSWVFGDIIVGGIIGLVIDYASGAMYSIEPDKIHAKLLKEKSALLSINAQACSAGQLQKISQMEKVNSQP